MRTLRSRLFIFFGTLTIWVIWVVRIAGRPYLTGAKVQYICNHLFPSRPWSLVYYLQGAAVFVPVMQRQLGQRPAFFT